MRQFKRLIYYLSINVLVSACTVWAVLSLWERTHPPLANSPVQSTSTNPIPAQPNQMPTDTGLGGVLSPEQPTQALRMYQVLPGDTLGDIANRFDVSVDDLLELNGLSDANQLGSGQVLFIPLDSTPALPPATSEAGSSPALQQGVVTISSVIGAGDPASERVVVSYLGEGELSLFNWRLQDMQGNTFTFPQLTLFKDGAVNVYTRAGVNTVVDLYWAREDPVWETGEIVTLINEQENVQATYRVP